MWGDVGRCGEMTHLLDEDAEEPVGKQAPAAH